MVAIEASAEPDVHLVVEDRSAAILHRLNVWKDEAVAWVKTLASAAVYATLIVTFGFQVARVEGQSMAPTLADQDRLIVNKLTYRWGFRAAAISSCSITRSIPTSRSSSASSPKKVTRCASWTAAYSSMTFRCRMTSCLPNTAAMTTSGRRSFPRATTS